MLTHHRTHTSGIPIVHKCTQLHFILFSGSRAAYIHFSSRPFICLLTCFYLFLHPSLLGPGTETFLAWTYLSCRTVSAIVPCLEHGLISSRSQWLFDSIPLSSGYAQFNLLDFVLYEMLTGCLETCARCTESLLVWSELPDLTSLCCASVAPDIPALMAASCTAIISFSPRRLVFWFWLFAEHFKALWPTTSWSWRMAG